MTETEKAAIDSMRNNHTVKQLLMTFPQHEALIDQLYKAAFLDGVLAGLQRAQSGTVKL